MAEAETLKFDFKEVATALVKQADLHTGLWAIYVEFGIGAANVTDQNKITLPTALVPIVNMGLRRATALDNLSVDAAEVNPAQKTSESAKLASKRGVKKRSTASSRKDR